MTRTLKEKAATFIEQYDFFLLNFFYLFMQESDSDKALQLHCPATTVSLLLLSFQILFCSLLAFFFFPCFPIPLFSLPYLFSIFL